jgi:hypothetical protein
MGKCIFRKISFEGTTIIQPVKRDERVAVVASRLDKPEHPAVQKAGDQSSQQTDVTRSVGCPSNDPASRPQDASQLGGVKARIFDVLENRKRKNHVECFVRKRKRLPGHKVDPLIDLLIFEDRRINVSAHNPATFASQLTEPAAEWRRVPLPFSSTGTEIQYRHRRLQQCMDPHEVRHPVIDAREAAGGGLVIELLLDASWRMARADGVASQPRGYAH